MSSQQLDDLVAQIIAEAGRPLSVPQIEHRVVEREIEADTYDVQRAVQRLVQSGRAIVTNLFQVTSPRAAVQ